MDPRNDEPFDRAPWRRLLGADSGAPTRDLDQRILAEARRALAPRVSRWLLPVSLAASLLLAVLIVQWQLADSGAPRHVTESDVLSEPASSAVDQAVPPPSIDLPAERRERMDAPLSSVPPPAEAPADSTAAEAPAAAEQEQAPSPVSVTALKQTQAQPKSAAESAGALTNMMSRESYVESRTPEQWYADIEALRKSGRTKEADAELARFKSKYPDWLEHHQHPNP